MFERQTRVGVGLLGGLVFQLLMLSIYLLHDSYNGFFGQATGEVFVTTIMGQTGVDGPAYLMQARPGLALSLQAVGAGITLVALGLLVVGYRRARVKPLRFLGMVLGNLFLWAWVSLITGFFVIGIIAILPTGALWIALSALIVIWLVIIWRTSDNDRIWVYR